MFLPGPSTRAGGGASLFPRSASRRFAPAGPIGAVLLAIAVILMPAGAASMDETVDLRTDIARLYTLPAPAGTIIIGNPAIADATIADPTTLILTGRSSGVTNMIIMHRTGELMVDLSVRVIRLGPRTVTVRRPDGAVTQFFCAGICEALGGGVQGGGGAGQSVADPGAEAPDATEDGGDSGGSGNGGDGGGGGGGGGAPATTDGPVAGTSLVGQ